MKTKNNQTVGFSYYGLSLLAFLKASHPDKATNIEFINARADVANVTFSDAIVEGYSQIGATELANEVLYKGLHFSKHDTIVDILWSEFANEILESQAKEVAIKLYPRLTEVFSKYDLTDDFAGSIEYGLFYTELTGAILICLEEDGVQ